MKFPSSAVPIPSAAHRSDPVPFTEEGTHRILRDLSRDPLDGKDDPLIRSHGLPQRLLVVAVALASLAFAPAALADSPRSGDLHITKECSQFTGLPGSFCTITSSNINAIKAGSKVVYASGPVNGTLDTDITIVRNGNSVAFGHVTLYFGGAPGLVTLSGGTGEFIGFSASAVVTHPPGHWEWNGTYSFSPPG